MRGVIPSGFILTCLEDERVLATLDDGSRRDGDVLMENIDMGNE